MLHPLLEPVISPKTIQSYHMYCLLFQRKLMTDITDTLGTFHIQSKVTVKQVLLNLKASDAEYLRISGDECQTKLSALRRGWQAEPAQG